MKCVNRTQLLFVPAALLGWVVVIQLICGIHALAVYPCTVFGMIALRTVSGSVDSKLAHATAIFDAAYETFEPLLKEKRDPHGNRLNNTISFILSSIWAIRNSVLASSRVTIFPTAISPFMIGFGASS